MNSNEFLLLLRKLTIPQQEQLKDRFKAAQQLASEYKKSRERDLPPTVP